MKSRMLRLPCFLPVLLLLAAAPVAAQECPDGGLPRYLGAVDGAYAVAATPVGADLVATVTVDSALVVHRAPADAPPSFLTRTPLVDDHLDVTAVGDHVYVAGDGGVRIFAVGADGSVVDHGRLTGLEGAVDLAVDGDLLAVVHAAAWSLWDCSDPALPVRHVRVPDATGVTMVAVGGGKLVTGMHEGPNQVFDIADPAAAVLVGTYSDPPYTNEDDGIYHEHGRFLHALEIVRGRTYELRNATQSGGSWIYGDRWYMRSYALVVRDLTDPADVFAVRSYDLDTDSALPMVAARSALARAGDLLAAGQQASGRITIVDAALPPADEPRILPATNEPVLAWRDDRLVGLGYGAWAWEVPADMAPGTVPVSGAGSGGDNIFHFLEDVAVDAGLVATSVQTHIWDEHWEDIVYHVGLYQPAVSTTGVVTVATYSWDPTYVALLDDLLVVTNSSTTVFDITDPASPGPGQTVPALADARRVAGLGGRLLAVGTATGELQVVDLTDPAAPAVLGSCTLAAEPYLLRSNGAEVLVAAGDRIEVVHVVDPAAPTLEASIVCPGPVRALVGERGDGLAVVAGEGASYQMVFDYPAVPIGIPDGAALPAKAAGNPQLTRLSTHPQAAVRHRAHFYMAGQGFHAVKIYSGDSAGSVATSHPVLGAVSSGGRLYAVCLDMLVDVSAAFCSLPSGVRAPVPAAGRLALAAAPNPFNPLTRVAFTLDRAQPITLAVYDLKGRRVRELARGTWAAERHIVTWNGRDDRGRGLASGVYFVRLTAGVESAVTKVTLIK